MAEPLISPLRPAAEARGVAPSTAEEPTATILVCDDHAEIVEMLVSVLQLEGFQPVPAYCGADALHAVQQRHIDLVLLDKAMPDIDGFEVCRRIKEMFALRFLPVILVTAKAHKQDRLAGLSLGADDYITKPFDLEELLAKVRVMLRIKRVEDQLFQRNIELASFNAVAGVVGESLILEEMLHNSLAEILRLMDLPAGWIFLWDEQAHTSCLAVYLGVDAERASSPLLYATDLLYQPGGTAATRHECDWLDAAFRARNGLVACISIPLKSKGRVLGFMNLASRHPGAFQPRGSDLQVLESLGFELGVAVEHALLYRDARHMVEQLREVVVRRRVELVCELSRRRPAADGGDGDAELAQRERVYSSDVPRADERDARAHSRCDARNMAVSTSMSSRACSGGVRHSAPVVMQSWKCSSSRAKLSSYDSNTSTARALSRAREIS